MKSLGFGAYGFVADIADVSCCIVLSQNLAMTLEEGERETKKRKEALELAIKEAAHEPVKPEGEKINRGEKKKASGHVN